MNQAQRERIRKRQVQLARARKLKAQRQEKIQQQAKAKAQKPKPRLNRNFVSHALPVPEDIKADEYNKECYIVGGGPSLIGFDWSNLDNKFVIAINRAYEVLPEAQIVYFTDDDYYQRHRSEMLVHKGKKFRGRLARKPVIKDPEVLELQLQAQPWGWSDQFGELYHGSNSTYACIQVAAQLGFKKIYLLGIDMKHQGNFNKQKKNNQGVTHWHNGHRRTDPAHAYKMMIGHYQKLAPEAKKRGIEVINVSSALDGTALKVFPIKTFDEVFK
jgi:uncharacterized Rossmann fold enzyme